MYSLAFLEEIGDKQYLLDMITLVIENTRKQFDQIRDGMEVQDWDMVLNNAHKAKGSIGMLQASELMEVLARIEQVSKESFARHELPELASKAATIYEKLEFSLIRDQERIRKELSAS